MTETDNPAVEAYDTLAGIYDLAIPDPAGFTDFYLDSCRGVETVLYVGCGTGRLLAGMAESGILVVGVDPSTEMLRRAQERLDSMASRVPNSRDVELTVDQLPELGSQEGRLYDRVIAAGGAFEYLMTTRDQIAALRRMGELLTPDGQLLIDVAAPPFASRTPRGNYVGDGSASSDDSLGPDGSASLVKSSEVRFAYDHFHQVLESRCHFYLHEQDDPVAVAYRTRYTTIAEWRMLLPLAGLRGQIFGGFRGEPVTRNSSNFVISAGVA